MSESEWHCGCPVPPDQNEPVIFARYVDDIIRSARKDDIPDILKKVDSLHPNLQFTTEYPGSFSISCLDLNVRLDDGKLSTGWHQKPTDTGILLSFSSLAPTQYKKNIVEGTVHRIFNATSSWQLFHQGLAKAMTTWENTSIPPIFSPDR